MKHFFLYIASIVIVLGFWSCNKSEKTTVNTTAKTEKKFQPNDYFFIQRTYPDNKFALKAYEAAIVKAQVDYQTKKRQHSQRSNHLEWRSEGPGNIGGRFNTLAVHPINDSIIYAGSTAGGVFKTTDAGQNWLPIFDDQPFLAIGDIELDPNNPDIIYVGTGDPNISGYPFIGNGVYKSTNAGQSWTHLGLTNQRIISKVKVHPQNSNLIYAAAMGLPFERNNDRGLYKSTDAGQNWQQVLFLTDSAGIIDLLLHPTDTNIVYATGWNRIRNNTESMLIGKESRIYKSIDGGQSWNAIMTGIAEDGYLSRISLDMSGTNPDVIFASVIDSTYNIGGIYKSSNGGSNWALISSIGNIPDAVNSFGWYFGHVMVNPVDDNDIYLLGVELHRTDDGGLNWDLATPEWWQYIVHADMHDLVFNNGDLYLATDGGVYKKPQNDPNWIDIENIPVTQFYHVAVRNIEPGVYYGGAQDNGTMRGNATGLNTWPRLFGGDGFDIQLHPIDDNIFYAETQNGGIVSTTNGGNFFRDAENGIDESDRRNWDMPYKISYHNPNTLFAGTYRIYKNTSGTNTHYNPVSGDLTDGIIYGEMFHTISVIDESRTEAGKVFAGTSDGNLWRSTDNGNNWVDITGTLPNRYITDVETSHNTPELVIVSHSGYKDNDFIPHVHLSTDNGDNWLDISGDLPQIAVNDVEISSTNDSLIFVATDGGVYFTTNQGINWERLGYNMPVMAVYDIEIDIVNQRLVAGTFARSIMSVPIDSLINELVKPTLTVQIVGNQTICKGESTILTASSIGSNLYYSWTPTTGLSCTNCNNPVASPTVTTTYYVEVSNGGVSLPATDSIVVTVGATFDTPDIQADEDSLFTDVTSGLTYQWLLDGVYIPGATMPYYIASIDGYYSVIATNAFCSKSSYTYPFIRGSVQYTYNAQQLSLYPNPMANFTTIELPNVNTIYNLDVFDISGKRVYSNTISGSIYTLQKENLQVGVYFVVLKGDGVYRAKLVVE